MLSPNLYVICTSPILNPRCLLNGTPALRARAGAVPGGKGGESDVRDVGLAGAPPGLWEEDVAQGNGIFSASTFSKCCTYLPTS